MRKLASLLALSLLISTQVANAGPVQKAAKAAGHSAKALFDGARDTAKAAISGAEAVAHGAAATAGAALAGAEAAAKTAAEAVKKAL